MGQVTSLAERQNGFAPFRVGVDTTFLFSNEYGDLGLVSGPVADLTPTHVVINDVNVDGSRTKYTIEHQRIEERFL